MSRQISCQNGHYYSSDLGSCPFCSEQSNTVLIDIGDSKKDKVIHPSKIKDTVKTTYLGHKDIVVAKEIIEEKVEEEESSSEDVILAGWLVIISDIGKGSSFNVTFGFNTIGREKSNHIAIVGDKSISRSKHASIIYDYSNNIYFIKHEDGKFLTYLNAEVVFETKELKAFDKIKIGGTELLFVPLCGDNFKWDE
jgi:hypothetical protein